MAFKSSISSPSGVGAGGIPAVTFGSSGLRLGGAPIAPASVSRRRQEATLMGDMTGREYMQNVPRQNVKGGGLLSNPVQGTGDNGGLFGHQRLINARESRLRLQDRLRGIDSDELDTLCVSDGMASFIRAMGGEDMMTIRKSQNSGFILRQQVVLRKTEGAGSQEAAHVIETELPAFAPGGPGRLLFGGPVPGTLTGRTTSRPIGPFMDTRRMSRWTDWLGGDKRTLNGLGPAVLGHLDYKMENGSDYTGMFVKGLLYVKAAALAYSWDNVDCYETEAAVPGVQWGTTRRQMMDACMANKVVINTTGMTGSQVRMAQALVGEYPQEAVANEDGDTCIYSNITMPPVQGVLVDEREEIELPDDLIEPPEDMLNTLFTIAVMLDAVEDFAKAARCMEGTAIFLALLPHKELSASLALDCCEPMGINSVMRSQEYPQNSMRPPSNLLALTRVVLADIAYGMDIFNAILYEIENMGLASTDVFRKENLRESRKFRSTLKLMRIHQDGYGGSIQDKLISYKKNHLLAHFGRPISIILPHMADAGRQGTQIAHFNPALAAFSGLYPGANSSGWTEYSWSSKCLLTTKLQPAELEQCNMQRLWAIIAGLVPDRRYGFGGLNLVMMRKLMDVRDMHVEKSGLNGKYELSHTSMAVAGAPRRAVDVQYRGAFGFNPINWEAADQAWAMKQVEINRNWRARQVVISGHVKRLSVDEYARYMKEQGSTTLQWQEALLKAIAAREDEEEARFYVPKGPRGYKTEDDGKGNVFMVDEQGQKFGRLGVRTTTRATTTGIDPRKVIETPGGGLKPASRSRPAELKVPSKPYTPPQPQGIGQRRYQADVDKPGDLDGRVAQLLTTPTAVTQNYGGWIKDDLLRQERSGGRFVDVGGFEEGDANVCGLQVVNAIMQDRGLQPLSMADLRAITDTLPGEMVYDDVIGRVLDEIGLNAWGVRDAVPGERGPIIIPIANHIEGREDVVFAHHGLHFMPFVRNPERSQWPIARQGRLPKFTMGNKRK
uniref:Uncharacterized protein n=1 Tax=Mesotaenium kramstae alphachyrso-like virus TaxID=2933179 RepID=A0A9C7GX29_9VIRU|nr:hypothetical protein [Mesotaenium kramstae alphachyrso-like virus]CAI5383904.1 hypothetical protein [Mesotaenium kramstae alphachyrso-like virus]